MDKDYTRWHKQKAEINDLKNIPQFHEREIWWSALGANVGDEEDGKNDGFERPIVIYRKFNKKIFWGLPISSRPREGIFYFTYIRARERPTVLLSQIRLLDAKRLRRKMGILSSEEFRELDQAFLNLVTHTAPPLGGASEAEAV